VYSSGSIHYRENTTSPCSNQAYSDFFRNGEEGHEKCNKAFEWSYQNTHDLYTNTGMRDVIFALTSGLFSLKRMAASPASLLGASNLEVYMSCDAVS
jgi:predicted transcriptional regulator YheO